MLLFTNAFIGRHTLYTSELLCSRVKKEGLRRKRGKDFFPYIS